jgi:hypothetical protein
MESIANILLICGAFASAFYCLVLARRISGLKNLDQGLGGAIAALSRQVDGMQASLETAKRVSGASVQDVVDMTARAEIAAGRLEILLAKVHERDTARPKAEAQAAAAPAGEPPLVLRHANETQAAIPERLRAVAAVAEKPRQPAAETSELLAALKQALNGIEKWPEHR